MQDESSDEVKCKGEIPIFRFKINYAGVIPVIFASSLLMFPATLGTFVGRGNWLGEIAEWLSPGSPLYLVLFVA